MKKRIAILGNVPLWLIPELSHIRPHGHYATWLEAIIPYYEALASTYEIHWITMSKEVSSAMTYEAFGQAFHVIPRWKMSVQILTAYATEIWSIRHLLKKLRPDLVHAWGSEDVYGMAGAASGVRKRIFTLQGCQTHGINTVGGPFLKRVRAWYEQPTLRRYPYATAESDMAARLIRELNPKIDCRVIEYGVHAALFERHWKPVDSPKIIFVGTVNREKGIIDLMEVSAQAEFDKVRFIIAGDGPLKTDLSARYNGHVKWLGRVGRKRLMEEFDSSWLLCIPTYLDTGPTVVKEARVVGLPVITTTAAGASQYIEKGKSGVVIEAGDKVELAAAIRNLVTSREHCMEVGRRNWQRDREDLHPRRTAESFGQLYQEV